MLCECRKHVELAACSPVTKPPTPPLLRSAEGDINYDAVVAQSKNAQQWLQTTHKALVPKPDELLSGVRATGVL